MLLVTLSSISHFCFSSNHSNLVSASMIFPKAFPWISLYTMTFLWCFSLHLYSIAFAFSGNETDYLSLVAIRDQIEGLDSWNKSSQYCQWEGVYCSKRHPGRVRALVLHKMGLVGTLSPHIGNLSFLWAIDFGYNKVSGKIPQEIGRLSRLQYIFLNRNAFEGEVPANLSQCGNIKTINLLVNKLSGHIPAELGYLSNLEQLILDVNRLNGEIPPSFGNLSTLRVLSIPLNSLEGSIPHTVGTLFNLELLHLGSNQFSGQIPLSVFNISSLEVISTEENQFTGSLPPNMGITLPSLRAFATANNQLSGPLPVSLTNASNLQVFNVPTNHFTGQVPSGLGALPYLSRLGIGANKLGKGKPDDLKFVSSLTNSSSLWELGFGSNNFGGNFPNSICNLSTQMEFLTLEDINIFGVIPEGIGNLSNLTMLDLSDNLLSGTIPSSIGHIHTLGVLVLARNKFTGVIPFSLGNMSQLSRLHMENNKLEGNIPSSLGGCVQLEGLNLSRNILHGTIPEQVMTISSLSLFLDFSHNSLTGSIPRTVGNLTNLSIMDISGNQLSGELPITLGSCVMMEQLRLENNMFEGPIPQALSLLKVVQHIDLSYNNLSGQIPKYFESYPFLQILNLSFNKFEGEVPTNGIFRNATAISLDGNYNLCGGIHQLLLPPCQTKVPRKDGRSLAFKLEISISLALFFLFVSTVLIIWRRRKPTLVPSSTSIRDQHAKVSYRDLFQATGGFSSTNFVGSGSFGRVYKAMLNHYEAMVAIKIFNLQQKGAWNSFIAECESLRNIRHRNLVKILTSCSSIDFQGNAFKALVFEFMPNGSLEKWLHGGANRQENQSGYLNMLQRLNIVIDVASALIYLHHECHVPIIHCDLKPSNVLLDNDMSARVGDFGLAKVLSESMENYYNNQSSSVALNGSVGYIAPEYGMGGEASIQGDVYSFGILVLEMLTGKTPVDEIFQDGLNIHNYANRALPNHVIQIVDPILLSELDESTGDAHSLRNQSRRNKLLECIISVIRIGIACSVQPPGERMDMRDVTRELHTIRDSFLTTVGHGVL